MNIRNLIFNKEHPREGLPELDLKSIIEESNIDSLSFYTFFTISAIFLYSLGLLGYIPRYTSTLFIFSFIIYDFYPVLFNINLGMFDIRKPSKRDFLIIIFSLISIFAIVSLITAIVPSESSSSHTLLSGTISGFEVVFYLLFFWIIVAPFEELFARYFVQRIVLNKLRTMLRVSFASILFSSIHIFSYSGDPYSLLISIFTIFLISIVLGFSYEFTDNLTVPIIIHGFYNSIVLLFFVLV